MGRFQRRDTRRIEREERRVERKEVREIRRGLVDERRADRIRIELLHQLDISFQLRD
jgi:hypothetical protein